MQNKEFHLLQTWYVTVYQVVTRGLCKTLNLYSMPEKSHVWSYLTALTSGRPQIHVESRGFPDSDDLVNCTLLCTLRPWRIVNLQLKLDSTSDKVVQNLGLQSGSIKSVISNVLVNFYGLKITSSLYKQKFKHFCAKGKPPRARVFNEKSTDVDIILSCMEWGKWD